MATRPLYYGSLYWATPAATDNVLDTPIKCAGVTHGMESSGFAANVDNRLTYSGAVGARFLVTATFSASCSGPTEAIFYLYKNGTKVAGTDISRTIGAGAQKDSGACAAIINLLKDDYVELWCETNASADDITIESGTICATVAG